MKSPRTFTAKDYFVTTEGLVFMVPREHPKVKPVWSELPRVGDRVVINEIFMTVFRSHFMGDSECKHWPEIALYVTPVPNPELL